MYSAVLMAALATTTTAPNWHYGNGCHACYGGYTYANPGCGGCYGGCYGNWTFGGYGFAGGGNGYHGGCYGAYGSFYDPYGGCTGCYGCYGGYSCYGIPVPAISAAVNPAPVVRDPFPPINPNVPKKDVKGDDAEEVGAPKEKKKDAEEKKKLSRESDTPIRAKVRIEVPESGKLFVDGNRINVAAGVRTFQTPALAPGERYFYDIRIDIERGGEIRSEQRRVIIEAGKDVAVRFPGLQGQGTDTAQANR